MIAASTLRLHHVLLVAFAMSSLTPKARSFGALTCRVCKRPIAPATRPLQWTAIRSMSIEGQQKVDMALSRGIVTPLTMCGAAAFRAS